MAKVTLNTREFASMLNKVSKCTSKGGIALVAQLVEIRLNNGTLSLRTTDTRNIMILRKSGVAGDDFVATISLDVFEKIVSRTSKEEIELVVDDRSVQLKGNGVYNFPLTIEGDEPVTFPRIGMIEDPEVKKQFAVKDFLDAIKNNGDFVGSPFVDPSLSGFYFGDNVVTSDLCTCCYLHRKFFDTPVMLYPTTLALLNEISDENVIFLKKGRKIQFVSSTCLIDSVVHSDVDNFPVDDFNQYLTEQFGSGVTISKKAAVEILERVSFFVDMKTEYGATIFDFKEDGIVISDRNGKASEVLPFTNPVNFQPFVCHVPAIDLIKVLDIEGDDEIVLWYANPTALRIDVNNVTRILALVDPDDLDSVAEMQVSPSSEAAEVDSAESTYSPEDEFADVQW